MKIILLLTLFCFSSLLASPHIEKILGGRSTSCVYKLTLDDHVYALRICDEKRSLDFYSPVKQEIECQLIANQLGICPFVHSISNDAKLILMDFISTESYAEIFKTYREQFYQGLANALFKIHHGPPFSPTSTIFEDIERAREKIPEALLPCIALTAIHLIQKNREVLSHHQELAPCHKELNFANILYKMNRVYLIDWETAGQCDPYVDLAIASNFLIYNTQDERLFLTAYFQKEMTPKQCAKLYLMKQTALCLYAFKLLRRVVKEKKLEVSDAYIASLPPFTEVTRAIVTGEIKLEGSENLSRYALILLKEVLAFAKSPQYEESLKCLSS